MTDTATTPPKSYSWSQALIQSLIMAMVIASLVTGLVTVLAVASPDKWWLSIPSLCFFVALEAILTTIWLSDFSRLKINHPLYRTAEFIFLAVITRLFAWAVTNSWPQSSQLRGYLLEPATFLDGFFVVTILLVFLTWNRSLALVSTFKQLAITPAESSYYAHASHATRKPGPDRPIGLDRTQLVAAFFQQWVSGGIILAFCAALTTLNLPELSQETNPFQVTRLGLRPEMLTALMIYFLGGFWLLSQAQLAVIQARWLTERVVRSAQVIRSWRRHSLWLLVLIAFVAAFTPIGSTLPIGRILNLLLGGLIYLVNILFMLITILVSSIASLFGTPPPPSEDDAPLTAPFDQERFQLPASPPPSETTQLILGSFFWLIILTLAIVAIIFFLRERGYTLTRHQLSRAWRQFVHWLRLLWQGLSQQVAEARTTLQARAWTRRGRGQLPSSPWRFIRLNALSPREQIRYFYLSTVRRAGKQGIERQQSKTPLEYAHDLTEGWPEAEEDVAALTDAFLKARYTPQTIEKSDANLIKAKWKRLRSLLRRQTHALQQQEED